MNIRSSCRWFRGSGSKRAPYPVPFVTLSGKFSLSTLCFWNAYPEQIFASLSSTVYSRLTRIVGRRHGFKYMRKCRDLLIKVSSLYTIMHNDWIIDRFLGILRSRSHRNAYKLLTVLVGTLGENKRFVYDQACLQASWLEYRARRVRDKPSKEGSTTQLLRPSRSCGVDHEKIGNPYKSAAKTWRTFYFKHQGLDELDRSSLLTGSSSGGSPVLSDNPYSMEWSEYLSD